MRPPDEVKKALVGQWLSKADQDLKAGEALLDIQPPFLYPACFHAQQAAEKYLKALLTWHQVEFPKTHAIELLLEILKRADPQTAIRLEETVELTPYGVDLRYPGDQPDPELSEAVNAIDLARKVRDAVMNRLESVL